MDSNGGRMIQKGMVSLSLGVVFLMTMSALGMHLYPVPDAPRSCNEGDSWALVFHFQPFKGWVCDRDITEILVEGGWQRDHIRVFEEEEITRKNFFEGFSWLDNQEGEGDTVLFFYNGPGHTGGIKLYNNEYYVAYPELDDLLDNLEAAALGVVIDACHSGAAGPEIQGEGRLVITGASAEEKIGNFMLSNLFLDGVMGLGDYTGNQDGCVSMEEAFAYLQGQWVYSAHPQMWDGYPGELSLARLRGDDKVDQYQSVGDRVNEISDIRWVAQSFSPLCEDVTRALLYVRRDAGIQDPLEVSIRGILQGPDLYTQRFLPENLSDVYRWVEIDFPDLVVTPGQPLFLVCRVSPRISGTGTYGWRGVTEDLYGAGSSFISFTGGESWESNPYSGDCVFFTFGKPGGNKAPLIPDIPRGATSGKSGHSYPYMTVTSDPEGDRVRYSWDWDGDGMGDEWTPFAPSGETMETLHAWNSTGTYEIRVKAQDEKGDESDWSDPLTVSMPQGSRMSPGGKFFPVQLHHECLLKLLRVLTIPWGLSRWGG